MRYEICIFRTYQRRPHESTLKTLTKNFINSRLQGDLNTRQYYSQRYLQTRNLGENNSWKYILHCTARDLLKAKVLSWAIIHPIVTYKAECWVLTNGDMTQTVARKENYEKSLQTRVQ